MSAVWMRLRAALRGNARAWIALALTLGVAGGAATAAAAGARRTATAYPRFYEANAGAHVVTGGGIGDDPATARGIQRALASLPQVEAAAEFAFVSDRIELPDGSVAVFPEALVSGDPSGSTYEQVNRAKVVGGRLYRRDAPDEAVIDLVASERLDVRVGDRVTVLLRDAETGAPSIRRPVTIVGVVIAPGAVSGVGEVALAGVAVSPAFLDAIEGAEIDDLDGPLVRLRRGNADIEAYIAAAREIAPDLDFPIVAPRHIAGVQKMMRYDTTALWILCALLALAALAIVGQALSRQLALEAGTHRVLAALGTTRGQLVSGDLLRALITGAAGAVVAVPVAIAASPLTPRGLARIVEPDPGVYVDPLALVIGAAATLVAGPLLALTPAIRLARRPERNTPQTISPLARLLRGIGAGPAAIAGTRLALDPGRGTRTVPVRATIAGLATAIAAVIAAGTFASSFSTLIARPDLYGFTWDVYGGGEDPEREARLLSADDDVEVFAKGGYGNIEVAGKQLLPMVYEPGTIEPTVLEGRAPRRTDEIALGSGLLRALDLRIGDQVEATNPGGAGGKRFTIVGRVVVPPVFFQQLEPGESSAMTIDAFTEMLPPEEREGAHIPHLIRYRPGTDVRAKVNELRAQVPDLFVGQIRAPGGELSALERSADLPLLLTLALLAMAVGTLAHTLVSSIRKRRVDLAVLKALGFVSRQIRATVAWQASVLVAIALVVGIPAGIAAGRWGWRWFADTLGVVPEPVSPLVIAVVAAPIGALILANIIALVPGRAAARMSAATALHVE